MTLLVGTLSFIAWLILRQRWSDAESVSISAVLFVALAVSLLLATHRQAESFSTSHTMAMLRSGAVPFVTVLVVGPFVAVVAIFLVSALPGVLMISALAVALFLQWRPQPSRDPPRIPILGMGADPRSQLRQARRRSLVPLVLLSVALLGLIGAAYIATPPIGLDRATWRDVGEGHTRIGGYVGRVNGKLYLATCEGDPPTRAARILVVPEDDVEDLRFGGDRYRFDVGTRPSLAQILASVSGEGSRPGEPLWRISLRPSRSTCPP